MSHARCNIAARIPIEDLRRQALEAFGHDTTTAVVDCPDWDAVLDFVQPLSETYGAEPGSDAWYTFREGDWSIVGDLTMNLNRDPEALQRLSGGLEEVVVAAVDQAFEYAFFAVYSKGQCVRRLILDEQEIEVWGHPVKAEKGRRLMDFTEEECDRLWTSYGLPTFEFDPHDSGPFGCLALTR